MLLNNKAVNKYTEKKSAPSTVGSDRGRRLRVKVEDLEKTNLSVGIDLALNTVR